MEKDGKKKWSLAAFLNAPAFSNVAADSPISPEQEAITAMLYRLDLAQLRCFPGLPRNEYAPEAALILMHILGHKNGPDSSGISEEICGFFSTVTNEMRAKLHEENGHCTTIDTIQKAVKFAFLPLLAKRKGFAWADAVILERGMEVTLEVQSILAANRK